MSDNPNAPPGNLPEEPDPDGPAPMQEPPEGIPVPPADDPPPLQAAPPVSAQG